MCMPAVSNFPLSLREVFVVRMCINPYAQRHVTALAAHDGRDTKYLDTDDEKGIIYGLLVAPCRTSAIVAWTAQTADALESLFRSSTGPDCYDEDVAIAIC